MLILSANLVPNLYRGFLPKMARNMFSIRIPLKTDYTFIPKNTCFRLHHSKPRTMPFDIIGTISTRRASISTATLTNAELKPSKVSEEIRNTQDCDSVLLNDLKRTVRPDVPSINLYTYRSHNCGELNPSLVGQSVTLCGWLQFQRMKKFFTLRDGYGVTQVIIPPDMADLMNIEAIPYESILKVQGIVKARPVDMINPKMATGYIEVHLQSLEVLNEARSNLPMEVRGHNRAKEATRLEYRYMDLRFADMQSNLRTRSAMLMRMREFLINHAGFVEVETPTLFRRTPGGAQEFVVPSRKAGHFYSLVQSPQQFKQMLMSGAIDRYFQIARCYRDESTRPDRQPEFTQLDIELSFTNRESIMEMIENLLVHCLPRNDSDGSIQTPFARMTYNQAMEEYGCDKPDIRFGMKLQNITEIFRHHSETTDGFGAYAVVVPIDPKHKYPAELADESMSKIASEFGIKFATIRLNKEPETWAKYNKIHDIPPDQLKKIFNELNVKRNDTIFLAYGPKAESQTIMGRVRLAAIDQLEQANIIQPRSTTDFQFLWVVDFPMFAPPANPDDPLETVHHPFTAPHPEDAHLLNDPTAHTLIRSQSYDLVLNGWEVGGGSIRIHQASVQKQVLDDILRIDHSHLNHLLDALDTGCPPHGGIALGLDRLLTIVTGATSMRDVIAFPKGADGRDPLSKAPVPISEAELKMYNISVRPTGQTS